MRREQWHCNLFYCDHARERRCCASCRKGCANRCQNDPHKCGCAEREVDYQARLAEARRERSRKAAATRAAMAKEGEG